MEVSVRVIVSGIRGRHLTPRVRAVDYLPLLSENELSDCRGTCDIPAKRVRIRTGGTHKTFHYIIDSYMRYSHAINHSNNRFIHYEWAKFSVRVKKLIDQHVDERPR